MEECFAGFFQNVLDLKGEFFVLSGLFLMFCIRKADHVRDILINGGGSVATL